MKDYPLFPELPEHGRQEAKDLYDKFKEGLRKLADDVLHDFYVDVLQYIESDTWSNFRNEIMDGFSKYGNRKLQNAYDFDKIRRTMFEEYKDEIIPELNQDLVKENEDLKEQIKLLKESINRNY